MDAVAMSGGLESAGPGVVLSGSDLAWLAGKGTILSGVYQEYASLAAAVVAPVLHSSDRARLTEWRRTRLAQRRGRGRTPGAT